MSAHSSLHIGASAARALRSMASAALVAAALVLRTGSALAEDDAPDTYARVIVDEVELRAGPGVSYRVIERAPRGQTFLVQGRENQGYWLEVLLQDGRTVYVLGDAVETIALSDDAPEAESRPGIFAPPALQGAHGGFTLQAGVLDYDAFGEVRPAFFLAPQIAFEPYVGIALQSDARRIIYGAAGALNFAPDWPVAPYFLLGAGGVYEEPRDDVVREAQKAFHARAGGGLFISFRWRVLVRLEATNIVLFTEDSYDNEQSYTGGLGTYF